MRAVDWAHRGSGRRIATYLKLLIAMTLIEVETVQTDQIRSHTPPLLSRGAYGSPVSIGRRY